MSYQEKRTLINIIAGIFILAAYCVVAFRNYQSGAVDLHNLRFFAVTMLVFIGIGGAATVVIQIVFHILMSIAIAVKEKMNDNQELEKTVEASFVEDEMDKLIELKSDRFGIVFFGIGFIASLVTLVIGYPPAVMLNILFLSFMVGALVSGALSIYYYRTGIR